MNGVTDDALCLYLFPRSFTHHATAWFEQMAKMFLGKYFPPSMVTKLRNEITNFRQRPDESLFEAWERYKLSTNRCPNHNMLPPNEVSTSSSDQEIIALKAKMAGINKNLIKVLQVNKQVKEVTPSCETYGGPHSYNDCLATVGQTQNVYAAGAYEGGHSYQPQGTLPCNTITNPKEDLKGITTRSGNAYQGPTIPTTSFSLPKVVERETEVTMDTVPPINNEAPKTSNLRLSKLKLLPNSEPVVSPIIAPVIAPTVKALIDVYEGELTLRVCKEAITFNLDQTSKYSANYNDMTANQIDVIDMACEEYSQEVLGFSDVIASGNPTPYYDPVVSTFSLTLTPFGDSDFLFEEVNAFLALEDDPTSREVDHSYYDPEGNILLLEAFLNDDPSLPPPNQGMYLPQEDLKGITTRSGTAYQGPTIPTTSFSLPKVVERKTEATKDTVHPTNNGSTKDVEPLVVQTKFPIQNSKPVVAPIIEPVVAPVSALKPNQRSLILFADALILMPKFGPTIKTLLTNKDKLSELARTLLNEHCSAVLLKKLLEKLRDPGKFLISCDFPRMAECLALADPEASINLMPLSVWNKLSLHDLSPTCMTLALTDRSISCSVGVTEDVFVKVGTFHFLADFVVVDFDADP
nr:reverse transcriptase domain-containing protein [Tanacetum cinerariifolium]